ncbi:hypothetical protein A0J61_01171 [Choanephora cucurbitarum]|uniref:Uncharacterized protein n=1 Tax=Choanephora cucurbitarum TaxID=101091 RepID=A0A1C7NNS2_9FUNG|nr:hypothetical protein A0J61_01171 [Choanephora cucurbitarum]
MNYHHRSIPSLSSSISSNDTHSPRTSSSSINYSCPNLKQSAPLKLNTQIHQKRLSEPLSPISPMTPKVKRWDDSQLEMELAEDDLIESSQKKVRRNSSLRLKEKLQLSESFIKEKLRSHKREYSDDDILYYTTQNKNKTKLSRSLKKVYDWLF